MSDIPKLRADAESVERLLDTAETFYGMHGMEGASLRQISAAAGSGNHHAVQYHFRGKDGLVRAILTRKAPKLEARRAAWLAHIRSEGRLSDPRALMDVIYRPLIEHVDSKGERRFARFFLALINSPASLEMASELLVRMPIVDFVHDLLHAARPEIPKLFIVERQRLTSFMVLTSIFNRYPPFNQAIFDEALIQNVLEMATAAVLAPLSDTVLEMLQGAGDTAVPHPEGPRRRSGKTVKKK